MSPKREDQTADEFATASSASTVTAWPTVTRAAVHSARDDARDQRGPSDPGRAAAAVVAVDDSALGACEVIHSGPNIPARQLILDPATDRLARTVAAMIDPVRNGFPLRPVQCADFLEDQARVRGIARHEPMPT